MCRNVKANVKTYFSHYIHIDTYGVRVGTKGMYMTSISDVYPSYYTYVGTIHMTSYTYILKF